MSQSNIDARFAPENGSPLKFKVGDKVDFTNDYGVTFRGFTVIGFCEKSDRMYQYGYRYYIDTDAHWFPKTESQLSFSKQKDTK